MHPLFDQRRYLIPFRSSLLPQIFTDVLVIGTGVAGLRAAVAAAEAGKECIVVTKTGEADEDSNTAWAQGGIAAVVDAADSTDSHIADTLAAGADLCDEPAVRTIIERGPARIRELIDWGMRFDLEGGTLALGQEGAHSRPRILHADGDATGRELARCLLARAKSLDKVRVFTKCFALDLVTPSPEPGSPVMGAITHHPRYGLQVIWARGTILAAGGAGMIYRETTNPRTATADGLAMAYRAGAQVSDLAFIQFHPTTLYLAGRPRSLITEAVRGEGALLLDQSGHRFMPDVHPMAELAPRDIVSRAIVQRLATHGGTHVLLDVRSIRNFAERFPGIAALLRSVDLDPASDLIPVNPAAHYTIGGVVTDERTRTNIPGLFAVGEVACTGLHGANRLASNSLLEGLVMGEIAGREAANASTPGASGATSNGSGGSGGVPPAPVPIISDIRISEQGELDLADVISSLRSAMWRNAGIERSGTRLAGVREMIDFWARYTLDKIFDSPEGWQTQNMLLAAALTARSAHWREESRGCHWRSDFTAPDVRFHAHDRWHRGEENATTVAVRSRQEAAA
ncbi:MAG: L-aspartate oxidase [Phycisphaeraceae bacterium]|nr:L-aspartate oxidase [Phycisphaeraceae bacterium]